MRKIRMGLKYALLSIDESCDPVDKFYYCDLSLLPGGLEGHMGTKELLTFVKLVDNFDASYEYVANDDAIFTFLTNKDAPRYKLVRVDLKEPNYWTVVLQEDKKDVLKSASATSNNRIVVNYLSDVKNVLQIRDLRTGDLLHHLQLDIGSVSDISARRKDSIIFFEFSSFLIPDIIYMCKLDGEHGNFPRNCGPWFDRTEFEASQIFVPSKDGTEIPIFLVTKKGVFLWKAHILVYFMDIVDLISVLARTSLSAVL